MHRVRAAWWITFIEEWRLVIHRQEDTRALPTPELVGSLRTSLPDWTKQVIVIAHRMAASLWAIVV